jgi:hypothetical protein
VTAARDVLTVASEPPRRPPAEIREPEEEPNAEPYEDEEPEPEPEPEDDEGAEDAQVYRRRPTGPGPQRVRSAPEPDEDDDEPPPTVKSVATSPFHRPNPAGIKMRQGKDYGERSPGHDWAALKAPRIPK